MTQIVVQLQVTPTPLPSGKTFDHITVTVTDNSGATLPAVNLKGTETPPWSATMTGTAGSNPATAIAQAVDSTGANLGSSITITESGTGGESFPAPSGGTITVT